MKNVITERIIHNGMNRITLRFPYDDELIKVVRGLPGARWSQQLGCWHIEDIKDIVAVLLKAFHGKAYIDYTALKSNLAKKVRLKREEEQRRKDLRSKDIIKPNLLGY